MSNFLRSMAARGYQIKPVSAKYAMQKYKHLIYRGDECIGQFKLKQDAEAAMEALIEVDYQKLVSEISRGDSSNSNQGEHVRNGNSVSSGGAIGEAPGKETV